METNEQSTELASAAPEATPVAPEVTQTAPEASVVQPEVKKEYVSTEPRHPLQDILDKAAKKAEEAKNAVQPETKKDVTLGEKPVENFDMSKWDGNALTLPDKIKKIVVDNQVAFHEKAKEAAELKAQYEALSQLVNQYTTQIKQTNQQKQPLFTQEEFESAQLDPNKFLELTSRVAKNIVDAEKAQIAPVLSQIEFNQKVVENERVINDFAGKHKDFWQLYDAGILEPLVRDLGLEQGYAKATAIAGKFQQQATTDSQARIQEKKGSVSVKPTNTQSIEVTYVDRPEDVLPTAARFAAEGKKIKVRVRPH